jgi:ribose transport system substrate-binding protein
MVNRRTALQQMGLLSGMLLTRNAFAQKQFKIALVMKALSNPFFSAMEAGAKDEAQKLGIELLVQGTNKETDIPQQINIVENFISRRVDAIVIAPASSTGLVPILFRAQERGIYIVNIDNPLDETAKNQIGLTCPFVGSDNALGASLAAHDLVAAMGGKGDVAILEGIPGVLNAELRKKGAMRIFDAEPGINVVASKTAQWEVEQGYQVFTNILTANPTISGLFAANDNMALGALRAIDAAGKTGTIHVVSYDNLETAQAAILSGKLLSTIEQHPELMGAYGVRAALDHLNGNTVPVKIVTPLDVIDYRYLTFNKK